MTTITSVAMILKEFTEKLKIAYPAISGIVFDPQTSYETSVAALRTSSKMNDKSKENSSFPFISFSRSALRPNSSLGERLKRNIYSQTDVAGEVDRFKFSMSEFDIPFIFYCNNASELEDFEIGYGSLEGISKTVLLPITIPLLGVVNYSLMWSPIDSISFNQDSTYYKSASGSVKVSGPFISLTGTSKIILDIYEQLYVSNLSGGSPVLVDTLHLP